MQPTSVNAPSGSAARQAPAGTTVGEAGAENDGASGVANRRDMQHQGLTRVEMPDLDGVDAVPARTLAFAQKVIDLRQRTTTAPGRRIAKSLTIPAVFWMRARARTAMIASESRTVMSASVLQAAEQR